MNYMYRKIVFEILHCVYSVLVSIFLRRCCKKWLLSSVFRTCFFIHTYITHTPPPPSDHSHINMGSFAPSLLASHVDRQDDWSWGGGGGGGGWEPGYAEYGSAF